MVEKTLANMKAKQQGEIVMVPKDKKLVRRLLGLGLHTSTPFKILSLDRRGVVLLVRQNLVALEYRIAEQILVMPY